MFRYVNGQFTNVSRNYSLDVAGNRDKEGNVVITWKTKKGARNQTWKILYVDQAVAPPKKGMSKKFGFFIDRPFYIVSKLPARRVLEVYGRSRNIVIMRRTTRKSQLFRFDNVAKTIKSLAYKNYSLQIAGEGRSRNVNVYLTNSRWFQLWKLKGEFIYNEKGKVLDVSGGRDTDRRNV